MSDTREIHVASIQAICDMLATGKEGNIPNLYSRDYKMPIRFPTQEDGYDGMIKICHEAHAAFTDLTWNIENSVVEGEWSMHRVKSRAKHTGPWMGFPPKGNDIEINGFWELRVVDGKAVEGNLLLDGASLVAQMAA